MQSSNILSLASLVCLALTTDPVAANDQLVDCKACTSGFIRTQSYCAIDNTCYSGTVCGTSTCNGKSTCTSSPDGCERAFDRARKTVAAYLIVLIVVGAVCLSIGIGLCVWGACRRRNRPIVVNSNTGPAQPMVAMQPVQPVVYTQQPVYVQQPVYAQQQVGYPAPTQNYSATV